MNHKLAGLLNQKLKGQKAEYGVMSALLTQFCQHTVAMTDHKVINDVQYAFVGSVN